MASVKFTGADAMMAKLEKLEAFSQNAFAVALRQVAEEEATEARRRCPVEHGTLRSSIHVEGPQREGRNIKAWIVAGGAAEDYALFVHEDLEAFHANGEAKFIERPLKESAPHLLERIAKRIDLNKVT